MPHEEAVEEEDAVGLVAGPGAAPVFGGHDAAAVGVRQQEIVELGQEAGRGRGVLVGAGCVGQVEEFGAALVLEDEEPGPQAFEGGAELGEAAPGLHVPDGGGPEGAEVAEHGLVEVGGLLRGAVEPPVGGGERDLAAAPPEAARGDLDQGKEAAGGEGEGLRVGVGPLGKKLVAQLLGGAGPLLDEHAGGVGEPVEVDAVEPLAGDEDGELAVDGPGLDEAGAGRPRRGRCGCARWIAW